jgi:uncharacterized protein involved in cysteine biosynthesis
MSLFGNLAGVLGRSRSRRPAGQTVRRARLAVESLEERQVLSTVYGTWTGMMPMPVTNTMMMPMPVAGTMMMHHGMHHTAHHHGHHKM